MTTLPTTIEVPDEQASTRAGNVRPAVRPIRRFVRRLMVILPLGLLLNVALTLLLSTTIDPFAGETTTQTMTTGLDETWTVLRYDRPGALLAVSEHAAAVSWSYRQACGIPDTPTPGDQTTAWAPSSTDSSIEWLELDFASAVRPASLRVVETYNPGALFKVDAYRADGSVTVAWEGVDPTPTSVAMGVSDVPLAVDFETKTVRIWIDSPKVAGWNEIDAVGLIDQAGNVQWAVKARASSFYGQGNYTMTSSAVTTKPASPGPAALLPSFGGLSPTSDVVSSGGANLERRVVVGFGWPMISLWTPLSASAGTAPAIISANALGGDYSSGALSALPPAPTTPAGGRLTSLPWRPAWPGFAVNTLLYATVVFILYWLAVKPRRFIAEVARIRRGACLECGYDLGYDFIRGCPECGWRRADRQD